MRNSWIYVLKSKGLYKIGVSGWPESRASEINLVSPFKVELVHTFPCIDAFGVEAYLHKRFIKKHHRCEWFRLTRQDVQEIIDATARLTSTTRYRKTKLLRKVLKEDYAKN